jgi:hypothetical protein
MENIGIVYGHLGKFLSLWYILWPIGTFLLVFVMLYQGKFGNTGRKMTTLAKHHLHVRVEIVFKNVVAQNRPLTGC